MLCPRIKNPIKHWLKRLRYSLLSYGFSFCKKLFFHCSIDAEQTDEKYDKVYQMSSFSIPYTEYCSGISRDDVKCIAFYFPQFHPFSENDRLWGRGFTDWTNVTRAQPFFEGHYQPRLPGELGFYDVRVKDTLRRQIEIAKNYGIYGFCFHHYWFMGKPVMRAPLDHVLAHPDLDIPFCLHWANEPWTVRWDGYSASGVLLDQQHTPEDDLAFIRDCEPALRDKRYIRIQGRPLLIIYRPSLFGDFRATLQRWNQYCQAKGIGKLYVAVMQTIFDGTVDPREYQCDAAIEYPPHNTRIDEHPNDVNMQYSQFRGIILRYPDIVEESIVRTPPPYTLFRGVMPDWDVTARRKDPTIFLNSTPLQYRRWLSSMIEYTRKHNKQSERYVFINAWNEWAEGAYVEPDRKRGYGYLQATREALEPQNLSIAIVAHLFHDEFAEEFAACVKSMPFPFDLYISTRASAYKKVHAMFSGLFGAARIHVRVVENQGRDMAPFLIDFADVYQKYDLICWVHSKKRKYNEDFCGWRTYLWKNLLGSAEIIDTIVTLFKSDTRLGIVYPEHIPPLSGKLGWKGNFETAALYAKKIGIAITKEVEPEYPAGNMFWFRPSALAPLFDMPITRQAFEKKSETKDNGTLAHALERLTILVCQHQKYHTKKVQFISWPNAVRMHHS